MEQQAINLVANILLVEDDDDLAELVTRPRLRPLVQGGGGPPCPRLALGAGRRSLSVVRLPRGGRGRQSGR